MFGYNYEHGCIECGNRHDDWESRDEKQFSVFSLMGLGIFESGRVGSKQCMYKFLVKRWFIATKLSFERPESKFLAAEAAESFETARVFAARWGYQAPVPLKDVHRDG